MSRTETGPIAPARTNPRILVIGDSHSTFWCGQNTVAAKTSIFAGIDVEHIGPVMAYSLPSRRSPAAGALESALAAKPDTYKLIVMSFGEVDIRAHVTTFAHLRGVSIDDVVEDVADCYLEFVDAMVEKHGVPVALWGPPPSRPGDARGYIPAFPVTGAPMERNYATMRMTRALAQRCAGRAKVEFFSLFDQLIGVDHRTLAGALYDSTHLSNRYLPEALVELRRVFARLGLQELEQCLERRWEVHSKPRLANVSTPYWTVEATPAGEIVCRVDLVSAYLLEEIRLAPMSVPGVGPLKSIMCGDVATYSETVHEGPAPEAELSVASAKRFAHRFVTFAFSAAPEAGPSPQATVAALKAAIPRAVRIVAPVFAQTLK